MASLSDSVIKMDTQVKKLELMKVLSLADIDKLDNMSASAIDKLYREKVIKKAGGGMMNISDMLKPVGYNEGTREGTLVGDREKMYAAPPPDPKDPDDLDMIINNMTFRVLHDKDRPMKENITRENYFDILPEERLQIAEQLRMQLGISSDSPQYEYIMNKIIEEADKINKIRQEAAQPTSTKILRGIGKLFGMEGNN
jgi:hypothetical protein